MYGIKSRELSELRKANVEKESKINETTSSIESQMREEVRAAVDKEKSAWTKKQETLRWEIESLRQDLARSEQQHAIREDMLRKEIADLQQVPLPLLSLIHSFTLYTISLFLV